MFCGKIVDFSGGPKIGGGRRLTVIRVVPSTDRSKSPSAWSVIADETWEHLLLCSQARVTSPYLEWWIRTSQIPGIHTEIATSRRKPTKPNDFIVAGRDVPPVVERWRARRGRCRAVPVPPDSGAVLEFFDAEAAGTGRDQCTERSLEYGWVRFDGRCSCRADKSDGDSGQSSRGQSIHVNVEAVAVEYVFCYGADVNRIGNGRRKADGK